MNNKLWIIGGANVDICGTAQDEIIEKDSNIGHIGIQFGGVGRNVAEICARLGVDVSFVTCFSSDANGKLLQEDCKNKGIDISHSIVSDKYPSSMYLAILDKDGDMHVGMNDMRILNEIDESLIESIFQSINPEDMLMIDGNLSDGLVSYISKHKPCMIASDPVSVAKCKSLDGILNQLDIFKPNAYEAYEYTGIKITDPESARENLVYFLNRGVKEVIISLANHGVLFGTQDELLWLTHRQIHLENATGGGDNFLGAYITQRLRGAQPKDALYFAITAAVSAIERSAEDRKTLSTEVIESMIEAMEIKELVL